MLVYKIFIKIKRKINFFVINYIKNQIVDLYKKIIKKKDIIIFDIGAGNRILNELINFDDIAKIYLIDPNDNINYSYNRLSKTINKKKIFKFQVAISDKTSLLEYHEAFTSTSSSFAINKNFIKKYNNLYKKKPKKLKVFSFKDFIIKNNLERPDIIKIDVEGLEANVIKSIFKIAKPLIIQVEVNVNNALLQETFTSVHNMMVKNNYNFYSILPSYINFNYSKSRFENGLNKVNLKDHEFNFDKKKVSQMECYYYHNKDSYNSNDLICFSAYGFLDLLIEQLSNKKNKINISKKKYFKKIYDIQKKYSNFIIK